MREAKVEKYEQLEEQMTALKKEEKDLKEEIQLLNDDEYLLDLARTNYFFSRKREKLSLNLTKKTHLIDTFSYC